MTIVFIDVVGSTSIAIDIEDDFADLIFDYRRIAGRIIRDHDGFVPKDEGDGRFVWFGWPHARPDDAQRAVNMARELMVAMEPLSLALEASLGRPLELRIGIHTGPVVVIMPGHDDSLELSDATVNFAAKVQQAAQPGTILISESTVGALLQPFELEPCGSLGVEGLSGGIDVFEVTGPAQPVVEERPFVGRRDELDWLLGWWAEAVDGGSVAVVVTGASGLGKSRLLAEFGLQAGRPDAVHVQGDRDRMMTPFATLRPVMAALLDHQPDARVAGLLGVADGVSPGAGLDRAAVCSEVIGLFRAMAGQSPVLLVVDDAMWLDASSAEVLAALGRAKIAGLMIAVTARRPSEAIPWPEMAQLTLEPFARSQALDLFLQSGPSPPVDPSLVERLVERAAGNPFFLLSLSRASHDDEYLGVRRLLRPRSGVPAVVQQAIRSQIDAAGVADSVTAAASTIGMEFDVSLLGAVLGLEPVELEEPLGQLVEHGVLEPVPGGEGSYRFTHGLVRDLAYDLLLDRARRQSHALVANALIGQDVSDHALVGLHLDRAGRWEAACQSMLMAVKQCLQSDAYQEGAVVAARALEIAAAEPGEVRSEVRLEAEELSARLAGAVSPDSYLAGTSQRSGLLQTLDHGEGVRRVVMAKTRDWAGAIMKGDLRTSTRLLREVRTLARREFPEILACNKSARGLHAAYRGRYALAERLLCESIEVIAAEGIDPWLEENWATPDDPIALAYSFAPSVLLQRGRVRLARTYLESAWQRAGALPGGAHTLAHIGSNAAVYWELVGNGEQAVRHGEEVANIGRELGLSIWEMTGDVHVRRGMALIEPSVDLVEQLDTDAALLDAFAPLGAPVAHLQAASAWLTLDEPERAGQSLARLRESSSTTGIGYLDAEELRLRSRLLEEHAAVDALVGAVSIAARQGARRFGLASLSDLARLRPGIRIKGRPVEVLVDEAGSDLLAVDAVPAAQPEFDVGDDGLAHPDANPRIGFEAAGSASAGARR